jgi:anhydro-N-acetylmuramic acid kinase
VERCALAGNALSRLYAKAAGELLALTHLAPKQIHAIGCHGQTIRHRPELGYTTQLVNPSLLAELCGIPVIADFRSRDIAAGGQGAPLVPAFHAALFRHPHLHRVVANIGGIANLTDLPTAGPVCGFDCGPGNLLLDDWANRHLGTAYDDCGKWAMSGNVIHELLSSMLADPFFAAPPPKSTGRDLFNWPWLQKFISATQQPADIQATLLEVTARGIADALESYCTGAQELYLCGGGAKNIALVERLKFLLPEKKITDTSVLGVPIDQVEAFAFAWLASQTLNGRVSNLPEVTGAKGPRILGAIYPA